MPHVTVIIMVNGQEVPFQVPHDGDLGGQSAVDAAALVIRFLQSDDCAKSFEKFAKHE